MLMSDLNQEVQSPELKQLLEDLSSLLVKVIDTENVSEEDEDKFDSIYKRYVELSDLDKSQFNLEGVLVDSSSIQSTD